MTTQVVPLDPVPSQSLSISLAGQNCEITLTTMATGLYFTLTADGVSICINMICRNVAQLLLDRGYLGFVGDFAFVDVQADADPDYAGLGSRWFLLYNDDPPALDA